MLIYRQRLKLLQEDFLVLKDAYEHSKTLYTYSKQKSSWYGSIKIILQNVQDLHEEYMATKNLSKNFIKIVEECIHPKLEKLCNKEF